MFVRRVKCLLVAAFSLFSLSVGAQKHEPADKHIDTEGHTEKTEETTKKFDANEVIFGHVLDAFNSSSEYPFAFRPCLYSSVTS